MRRARWKKEKGVAYRSMDYAFFVHRRPRGIAPRCSALALPDCMISSVVRRFAVFCA